MADYGIKISKPGFDVMTCADKDLVFSSKLNTYKVAAIGITTGDVAHGLPYTPAFFAARDQGTGGYYEPGVQKYSIIGQTFFSVPPYVTPTLFRAGGGANCKYYLFYVQGS